MIIVRFFDCILNFAALFSRLRSGGKIQNTLKSDQLLEYFEFCPHSPYGKSAAKFKSGKNLSISGKGKGTPMLKNGIKVLETLPDPDETSNNSDWQGF